MVVLMRDSGLRIGEALGLRRDDLHLLPDSRPSGVPWWEPTSTSATARTERRACEVPLSEDRAGERRHLRGLRRLLLRAL